MEETSQVAKRDGNFEVFVAQLLPFDRQRFAIRRLRLPKVSQGAEG